MKEKILKIILNKISRVVQAIGDSFPNRIQLARLSLLNFCYYRINRG